MNAERLLVVNARIAIPRSELTFRASRAGGPGGQHVNTSSTRVEVVWNVRTSAVLRDADRARLIEKLATRLDADGTLRVVSTEQRSQTQNRAAAEGRLADLVRRALVIPKVRRRTRTPRAAVEARLRDKKHRGERKRDRGRRDFD